MGLSRTVSEINVDFGGKSQKKIPTPRKFNTPADGVTLEIL